jgi:hypothetical protein
MTQKMAQRVAAMASAVVLAVSPMAASANTGDFFESNVSDNSGVMMADIVFARPLGVVASAVGFALFIVSLPFSITSNSGGEVAEQLVSEPLRYTFERPIGVEPREWSPGIQRPTGY